MIDMRDVASDIIEVVSGTRRSSHSRGKCQESQDWLQRDQSASAEEQYPTQAGTPLVLRNDWDQVRRGSSSGRPGKQGRKGNISTFGNFLPSTVAHASRWAQEILNMIVIPPMEISLTLSKGFHNAPLLFHDDTVRDSPSVTGIRSGLGAAGTVRIRPHLRSCPLHRTSDLTLIFCHTGIHIRHLRRCQRADHAASPRSKEGRR